MIDIKRSGYDNLFLVGGYDWHAKFTATSPHDVEQKAKTLSANFDKLDKKDVVLVAKWENEVLHACGLKGKPLPVVPKPEAVVEAKEPVTVAAKVDLPKPSQA